MRLTVPDAVMDAYEIAAAKQGRTVEDVVSAQLERFKDYPPGERTLAVNIPKVEAILGGLPIRDGADLLKRISDLASITFHGIRLDFTPGQLLELQRRADREEKSVEDLAKAIVEQLNRQFFWGEEAATSVR